MRQFREHIPHSKCLCLLSGPSFLDNAMRNENRPVWGAISGLGRWQFLFRAIIPYISLSEAEYNDNGQNKCSWQDTMMFARYTGYVRANVLLSFHTSMTTKANTKTHKAAWTLHYLKECLDFSGSGRHTLSQVPWTPTWNTYDTCLVRQLSQANSMVRGTPYLKTLFWLSLWGGLWPFGLENKEPRSLLYRGLQDGLTSPFKHEENWHVNFLFQVSDFHLLWTFIL